MVTFKYEKLKRFCFHCGIVGHGELFCPARVKHGTKDLPLLWNDDIHVSIREPATANKFLRPRILGESSTNIMTEGANKGTVATQTRIPIFDDVMTEKENEPIMLDANDAKKRARMDVTSDSSELVYVSIDSTKPYTFLRSAAPSKGPDWAQ